MLQDDPESQDSLEIKIAEIVKRLKQENKEVLAQKISASWSLSIAEYSQRLYDYKPQDDMEPELREAFQEELTETGYSEGQISNILADLIKNRTLQTSAHTEIAPPPRRFCIDWMSTCSLPADRYYIIGSFSGVPFSNKSKPGRINIDRAEQAINFIPKTHQDALVFSTNVPDKTIIEYERLPEAIHKLIPAPKKDMRFSDWAGRTEEKLLEHTLGRKITVLDINSVITRYLIKILPKQGHPLHKLLLDPETTQKALDIFGDTIHFFYTPYETGKYTKQENLYYLDGYGFVGDREKYPHTLSDLLEGLEKRKLCPAALLVFAALCFLNEFQCFGSFVQVEYVTRFKNLWQTLDISEKDIRHVPTDTLTTCMFPDDPHYEILEFILKQQKIPGNPNDLMGEYYLPIWQNDLYYTNKLT